LEVKKKMAIFAKSMDRFIILAIYSIIICMMLLTKQDTSIFSNFSSTDVMFDMRPALIVMKTTKQGHESATKVIKSQHLTCQFTRAGTYLPNHLKLPDLQV
jgi:hypothetical protein